MVLKSITIKDFLSIRGAICLDVDANVSVLLGANDHGKTNILTAIEHLNPDRPIEEDEVNWDAVESGEESSIDYTLELEPEKASDLQNLIHSWLRENETIEPDKVFVAEEPVSPKANVAPLGNKIQPIGGVEEDEVEDSAILLNVEKLIAELDATLPKITLCRHGIGSPLFIAGISFDELPKVIVEWLDQERPRVELIKSSSAKIQDSVTADEIGTDSFEFLQGVFFYAGLDPLNCRKLFKQNDVTGRQIDHASTKLDSELRRLWNQGNELGLTFHLRHKGDAIEFLADDPSVRARKTRMSKRSSGVTQFFRISMILHARKCKHPANSYLYLFDEPGVFLHPQGQKDLIQVFEQLASEAQVIYTTHSLFLLNQNFPERHRLIIREKDGTKVDQKPYRANWRLATDALGVYLTSNIIFSSRVLLVEGDSDPIYFYELFRSLNHAGEVDADANSLGILSFSDLSNLRFLLQIFRSNGSASKVLVLVDGDKQGKLFIKQARALCERESVKMIDLEKDKSIEDYVVVPDLWLTSVIETIRNGLDAEEKVIASDWEQKLTSKWADHLAAPSRTAGKWFKDVSKEIVGEETSKVQLARTYAFKCREAPIQQIATDRRAQAVELCSRIITELSIPNLRARTIVAEGL